MKRFLVRGDLMGEILGLILADGYEFTVPPMYFPNFKPLLYRMPDGRLAFTMRIMSRLFWRNILRVIWYACWCLPPYRLQNRKSRYSGGVVFIRSIGAVWRLDRPARFRFAARLAAFVTEEPVELGEVSVYEIPAYKAEQDQKRTAQHAR
jgi:hypothetical protein